MPHSKLLATLLFATLAGVPALTPPARAASPATTAASSLTIGILPFENLTGRPDEAWLGLSLAESLMGALSSLPGIQVIERSQLQHLLKELSFSQSALVDAEQAPALGRMAGAKRLILGSYELSGSRITLRARMLETETGQVVAGSALELSGERAALPELQLQLAKALAAKVSAATPAPPPTETQSEALRLYHQGLHLLEGDDMSRLPEMEALFHQALARDPGLALAQLALAKVHAYYADEASRELAGLREALTWSQAALRSDPTLYEAYTLQAWMQGRLNDRAAAAATLEQALKQFPGNLGLMIQLVETRREDPDRLLSPEQLRQGLAGLGADLDAPEVQAALGIRMVDTLTMTGAKDFSAARALLMQARQRLPENITLALKLASAYLGEDNPDTARIYLDQALAADPRNFWILDQVANQYEMLQYSYEELNRPEQAREALLKARDLYRQALAINPRYASAQRSLGEIYETLGDLPAAEAAFSQALAIDPDDPMINFELGKFFANHERVPQAIAALERARSLLRPQTGSRAIAGMIDYQLARTYQEAGQTEKAMPLVESLRSHPQYAPNAAMLEIEIHQAREDYPAAFRAYTTLFRLRPELQAQESYRRDYRMTYLLSELAKRPEAPELLNDIGQLAQEQGQLDAAEHFFTRALVAAPANPVILYNLGSLCLIRKRPAEAVTHLQAALLAQPRYPKAAYNLALAHLALGKPELARPLLKQVLQWEPGHAEAGATLSSLK